ncbi:c-type cytochrome biogenesis protein CcsB [Luteococcus sp. H138]|uniref:c-type cytochrome biogenesis protein CcsB n=1 Tax=unclassified Luteococcus TaxID=2639923 RepID=UPI00313E0238
MSIQELSALGIVTAAVVYLLAFMAHAAEWASARGLSAEPTGAEPVEAPELVGARAGSTAGGPVEATTSAEPVHASRLSSPDDEAARVRVDMFGRLGLGLTLIALVSHALGTVLRGVAANRAPWGNMYEFTISALLFVVVAYVWLALTRNMRWLGLPITLLLAVGNGLAATVFYVAVAPLVPALHSVWFIIHIVAACIAGAAFNLGGMASIIYLFQERAEAKAVGTPRTGYLAKLPTAKQMDTFAYRAHAFAFPIWTFTIAAGSIWAEYAWGRFWGWDPKETWSLVTWVVYAMYLHARATAGWRGRNAAVIAIIGVASFWFNFIGINLLVSGLHSYAGI